MVRNNENGGKCEMHSLGPDYGEKTEKSESETQTLFDWNIA